VIYDGMVFLPSIFVVSQVFKAEMGANGRSYGATFYLLRKESWLEMWFTMG